MVLVEYFKQEQENYLYQVKDLIFDYKEVDDVLKKLLQEIQANSESEIFKFN